jgi:hypothetical protein
MVVLIVFCYALILLSACESESTNYLENLEYVTKNELFVNSDGIFKDDILGNMEATLTKNMHRFQVIINTYLA